MKIPGKYDKLTKSIPGAKPHVIPWGLEPQSKEPESFILSIELRNRTMTGKDNKNKGRNNVSPLIFLFFLTGFREITG